MSRKLKVVTGIFLIVLSAGLMLLWELAGRDMLFNVKVPVTARDIAAGETIGSEDIVIKSISKESITKNCLTAKDAGELTGRTVKYALNQNSQIPVDSFISGEKILDENVSIYTVKAEWIKNLSSSVRGGDTVTVISRSSSGETTDLGSYYVAFVKDSQGREVVEATGFTEPRILKRTSGAYVPAEIEIAATLEEYQTILSGAEEGKTLIIIQEGVSFLE